MPRVDQWVWLPDEQEVWLPARITPDTVGDHTILELADKETRKYKTSELDSLNICAVSNFTGALPDLTKLADLSEGSVLYAVKTNYQRDEVFINIGTILVAINPFKRLPIYGHEIMERYSKPQSYLNESPHIYQAAMDCFTSLSRDGENASIIITGESGAGKTWTTRSVLDFLCYQTANKTGQTNDSEISMQDRILGTNPILEAFGNSKTVRNNNSSRFGKWMDIIMMDGNTIAGCNIVSYLLEKVRVCQVSAMERNYHIFYQLLRGYNKHADMKKKYLLKDDVTQYHYLKQGDSVIDIDNVDDCEEFELTLKAMKQIGLTQDDIESIIYILSGILNLGNIKFTQNSNEQSQVTDQDSLQYLENAATMFQFQSGKALMNSLCSRKIQTGADTMTVPINQKAAEESRDSLSMTIYDKLFQWIVAKVNNSLSGTNNVDADETGVLKLGILDIFGFEIFQKNYFEQFCINHANEKLQLQFNQTIFMLEQMEYNKEGIDVTHIEWTSNEPTVALVENKGIIDVLAEETRVPKGDDSTFKAKADAKFSKHESYEVDRKHQTQFVIHHFAGDVSYDTTGFIEKTKNKLFDHLIELTQTSKLPILAGLFQESVVAASGESNQTSNSKNGKKKGKKGGKKTKTLGEEFKRDLTKLVDSIDSTTPKYVRCIKPNDDKKPHIWDGPKVLGQMKAGGLFSAIAIRNQGFSYRKSFEYFVKRYKECLDRNSKATLLNDASFANDFQKQAQFILDNLKSHLDFKDIQVGNTKIFFRDSQLTILENLRDIQLEKIFTLTNAVVRGTIVRRRLRIMKNIRAQLQDAINQNDKQAIEAGLATFYKAQEHEDNTLVVMYEVTQATKMLQSMGVDTDHVDLSQAAKLDVIMGTSDTNNQSIQNQQSATVEDETESSLHDTQTKGNKIDTHGIPAELVEAMQTATANQDIEMIDASDVILTDQQLKQISDKCDEKYPKSKIMLYSANESDKAIKKMVEINNDSIQTIIDKNNHSAFDKQLQQSLQLEQVCFKKQKEPIHGTWTQRFMLKRLKAKQLNLFFQNRLSLLQSTISLDNDDYYKHILRKCHAISQYAQFHKIIGSLWLQNTANYQSTIHYTNTLLKTEIQRFAIMDQKRVQRQNLKKKLMSLNDGRNSSAFGADPLMQDLDNNNNNNNNNNGVNVNINNVTFEEMNKEFLNIVALSQNMDITSNHTIEKYGNDTSIKKIVGCITDAQNLIDTNCDACINALRNTNRKVSSQIETMSTILKTQDNNPLNKTKPFHFVPALRIVDNSLTKHYLPQAHLAHVLLKFLPLLGQVSDASTHVLQTLFLKWIQMIRDNIVLNSQIIYKLDAEYHGSFAHNIIIDESNEQTYTNDGNPDSNQVDIDELTEEKESETADVPAEFENNGSEMKSMAKSFNDFEAQWDKSTLDRLLTARQHYIGEELNVLNELMHEQISLRSQAKIVQSSRFPIVPQWKDYLKDQINSEDYHFEPMNNVNIDAAITPQEIIVFFNGEFENLNSQVTLMIDSKWIQNVEFNQDNQQIKFLCRNEMYCLIQFPQKKQFDLWKDALQEFTH